jgi:hypothetical protein
MTPLFALETSSIKLMRGTPILRWRRILAAIARKVPRHSTVVTIAPSLADEIPYFVFLAVVAAMVWFSCCCPKASSYKAFHTRSWEVSSLAGFYCDSLPPVLQEETAFIPIPPASRSTCAAATQPAATIR